MELVASFLVNSERIVQPILGFNLISALVKSGKDFSDFEESFDGISEENAIALLNFLRAYEPRRLAEVFTYKQGALIRADPPFLCHVKLIVQSPEERLFCLNHPLKLLWMKTCKYTIPS